MTETPCDHDRKLHKAKHVIDHLQAEQAKLQALDDLRRGQRDALKRSALHAFGVWANPLSSPEDVEEAMFSLRAATQF